MISRENLKRGLLLYGFFVKIGCFTFGGGWGILAQMEQEFVDKRQWITKEDLLDMTAVGRSLPGIMITNISMLFGCQVGGWFGGICAVAGIVSPAIVILSLVTVGYEAFKNNYWCSCALRGVRAAVVPIVGSVVLSLGKEALKTKKGICICGIACLLCAFTGISNVALVGLGVLAALIMEGGRKHGAA